jgi:uncharacterized membrane protein
VSRYELLLFLHVAMAVIWVGGGLMMQLFGMRAAMLGDRERLAKLGEDIHWIANRVFIPASLIAFLTGVLLVVDEQVFRWSDDWIVLGLLLYATTFLAGALYLGPESSRVGKLVEEGSPEAGPRMVRFVMFTRLDLVLLFLVIYVMTVKPEVDSEEFLIGLVGASMAGVIVWWRYRVALAQMLSGPPPQGPPPTSEEHLAESD